MKQSDEDGRKNSGNPALGVSNGPFSSGIILVLIAANQGAMFEDFFSLIGGSVILGSPSLSFFRTTVEPLMIGLSEPEERDRF